MKPDNAFDARLATKKLLREGRSGALATLLPGSGDPYCSLVNVATAVDGAPLLLLSTLALHTENILADERVSLMVDERKEGDPLEGARVMVMGTCAQSSDQSSGPSYLRRHPEAEAFANFADFAFYRIEIARAHLVAGFGRIVDLKPQDVLTDVSDARALYRVGA
jgi:heme iron utilization protein